MTKPSIWNKDLRRAEPCAFVISQQLRMVVGNLRRGVYAEVA